jgi:hypothetical protein
MEYMRTLFRAARRHVILYTSDTDDNRGYEGTNVRHRRVNRWIARHIDGWTLRTTVRNRCPFRGNPRSGSFCDFFFYDWADHAGPATATA